MIGLKYKGKKHLPLSKGPYTVGCVDIMTGNSINGTFMRLFYPSSETGILEHYERWPLWAPSKRYINGYASFSFFPLFITSRILDGACGDVRIPAIMDASPLKRETPFPIVIYSHGLFGCRTTNSTTHVELASHGFMVASLEHRDRSAGYTYYIKNKTIPVKDINEGDKRMENSSINSTTESGNTEEVHLPITVKSISRRHVAFRNKQLHRRAKECTQALDMLRDLNEGTAPRNVLHSNCDLLSFEGLFDISKVALVGHSFGGSTVLLGLANDPRFRVGVGLDVATIPLEMEMELPSRLTQPILFIRSTNFYREKDELEFMNSFQLSESERKYATISGTTHLSQCDTPFMVPNVINLFTWGRIKGDIFTHMDIHNRLMMTFLCKHLDLPISTEYENYLISKSSQINFGTDIEDEHKLQAVYGTLMTTSILIGVFASLAYYFKTMTTAD